MYNTSRLIWDDEAHVSYTLIFLEFVVVKFVVVKLNQNLVFIQLFIGLY